MSMKKNIVTVLLVLLVIVIGCESTPWLSSNVRIGGVSADSQAIDEVVVHVEIVNENNFQGEVEVGASVDCGTVTYKEKRKKIVVAANSSTSALIEFKGISDRIPTMAKEFKYQVKIYSPSGRVIDESTTFTGSKLYGNP